MRYLYTIFIAASILFSTGVAKAQTASFLNAPESFRSAGMGRTDALDFASIAFSGSGNFVGMSYLVSTPSKVKTSQYQINGYTTIFEKFRLAIGGRVNNLPPVTGASMSGIAMSEIKSSEYSGGVGIVYQVFDNLAIAAAGKYVFSSFGDNTASTVAGDLSVAYSIKRFIFGIKAGNLGGSLKYSEKSYPLPSYIKAGGCGVFDFASYHSVAVSAEAGYSLPYGCIIAGAGVEYCFNNLLFVRGGYYFCSSKTVEPNSVTAGVGLHLGAFNLSAFYTTTSSFGIALNAGF